MSTEPASPFTGMEPDVEGVLGHDREDVDTGALMSIAISLRRIADALTGQSSNIFTAPINSYGEGIGDAIQGQIVRGGRGIDQYEAR